MNWIIDWQAISARIRGLLNAGSFFYTALHSSSTDARSVKRKVLLESAGKIFLCLKSFSENYHSALPKLALESLNSFLDKPEMKEPNFFKPDQEWESGNIQFALTSLATFQSEFEYLISDGQFIARKITERAFIHLQRSIIVDDEVRRKWIVAFDTNEPQCEKLGALHLLLHGVWAFKANATGARTDLILNEPLPVSLTLESAADALVLTEWKLVKSQRDLNAKIQEALKQTEIYSSDVLGGLEIKNYRYLVMVSKKRMEMPDDSIKGVTKYRHINIAVDPKNPSEEARS